jgi:uncharacterized protein (DUF1499 family)
MKKRLPCFALTLLLLPGCTAAPEKPASGAALPPCGPLPNCVNSENGAGHQAIAPIQASPGQWQALKDWLRSQGDWMITREEADFLQAVAITPLMRYRDDVQLRFDRTAGIIHARSSSRLGIGDMGANRARVERLRSQVTGESPNR